MRKTAANRLAVARTAHAAITTQIDELVARRNAELMADDDAAAATLLGEIEGLRAVERGHADKIELLLREAERERADAIVRGHASLIGRFKKTLDGSDADLTEAADLFSQAWKKISSGIDKRERARVAFSVRSPHAQASAEAVEGCAMSAAAVMALLSFEFYRISARPLLGGRPGERSRPSLPGARPPDLQLTLMPEKIQPFAEKLRAASRFAVETLRDEIGSGGKLIVDNTAAPVAPKPLPSLNGAAIAEPERTPEQNNLSHLLQRANELASDDTAEGEQKYRDLMAQIPAAEAAANASIERTGK